MDFLALRKKKVNIFYVPVSGFFVVSVQRLPHSGSSNGREWLLGQHGQSESRTLPSTPVGSPTAEMAAR